MHAPRTRVQRRPVHGVLLLDKPLGLSSNQALQKAKWLLRAEKAGHTGTLDPLASGVLPLCFGAATKFSQIHLDADKTYETTVRLGVKTRTADAEGDVIETRPVSCTVGQVVEVLDRFMGPIQQVPPMHSALKKDGKALYEYARAGIELEREARRVTIHALDLLGFAGDRFTIRVHCSKGTYIRSLAMDIGAALGCGAHLCALRRTAIGAFNLGAAVTLAALEAAGEGERDALLAPADALVAEFPALTLDADAARALLQGRVLDAPRGAPGVSARVYGPNGFLGLGYWQDDGRFAPRRLIATAAESTTAIA